MLRNPDHWLRTMRDEVVEAERHGIQEEASLLLASSARREVP